MSYQVIARKWRPQDFDQLVGQAHISQTLKNALKNGRLPHALLFTGPRGTGKTSSARILAKSIRCPNAVDFHPCNQCEICEEISSSRAVDVLEIDGASNNGVDAIRELRDTVSYMPSKGKYKVYIIDEVHMLSTSAFNALLKTLEEPPEHVVFIMATTEVHKIPQTILSRCQRFDFRSIPTRQITERLKSICEADGLTADDEALWIIARQGDGSMRDSQSLLDQVITFANGPLTKNLVVEILGLTDRSLLLGTLTALVERQVPQILENLEKIHKIGLDASLFAKDLLEQVRNLLMVKVSAGNTSGLLELPDSEIHYLQDLANQVSEEELHFLFDMTLKGVSDLQKAADPRLILEMLLLRMVNIPKLVSLTQLFSDRGRGRSSDLGGHPGNISTPAVTGRAAASVHPANANSSNMAMSNSATTVARMTTTGSATYVTRKTDPMGMNPQERWLDFVQSVKNMDPIFSAKIEKLLFVGLKDKLIELALPKGLDFLKDQLADLNTRKKLQSHVDQIWGDGYTLEIKVGKEAPAGKSAQELARQKETEKQEELAKKIAAHPMVQAATQSFKGQIKAIKDVKQK
jgi:DNA polymerase-3 subunit gamma/tau